MDTTRMFAQHPPRSDMTSLRDVVEDWRWRFGPDGPGEQTRDTVVQYCADAPSLRSAVWRACMSIRPNGKMHNHQSRVPKSVRVQFYRIIIGHPMFDWMLGVKRRGGRSRTPDAETYTTFDSLYDGLDEIKPKGIGPVTVYDVATRIAAYLGCEEEQLYFHAGTREGWRALYPDGEMHGLARLTRIPRSMLPQSLQSLPTSEIEDFLCTYRKLFPSITDRQ